MKRLSLFLLCMAMLTIYAKAQNRSGASKIKTPNGSVITTSPVATNAYVTPDASITHEINLKNTVFVPVRTYKLTGMTVYPLPGVAYTQEEWQAYDHSLKKDWINNTTLEFGNNNQIWFKSLGSETRNGTSATWFFENKNCTTCTKSIQMEILSENGSTIDYIMEDEDRNPHFKIKLSFSKI